LDGPARHDRSNAFLTAYTNTPGVSGSTTATAMKVPPYLKVAAAKKKLDTDTAAPFDVSNG
jgi:hypothetical protein